MTPAEEQAAFLSIRGACLREHDRHQEALEAFTQAFHLAPHCLLYRQLAAGGRAENDSAVAYRREPAPFSGSARAEAIGWVEAPTTPLDPNPLHSINQPNH